MTTVSFPADQGITPPWRDTTLSVADRVDLLLTEMTLEEKVAQLGSRWVGNDMQAERSTEPSPMGEPESTFNVAPLQDVFAASGTISLEEASTYGLGHLTRVFGSLPVTVAEGAAELVRQHRVVLADSRLGIPALVHEECLTGFTTFGATVYPAAIAWGATFDADLVERMAAAIGRDMAAVGVHQGLSPVLDVVRDYRWGRVEETMGEDPYLVATLGAAYVRGLQSAGVIATLKHFAGYSASRAARNHAPVSMGRRELLDIILPTFETAVALAGARSVMNSYSDVDGVPAGADPWLLTEVLRDEWGFTGTVVSDYWAVPFLATMHRLAPDAEEAGILALRAGIDVELPDTLGFGQHLVERVRRGEVPEALVNRAARRLLRQKIELGLLDPQWTPEASVSAAAATDLDSPSNRALAREMAERSVVLLDAGTALPLRGEGRPALRRIAVVGPCADDPRTFMGCYAFPNHVLPRYPGRGLGVEVQSGVDALRAELPDLEVIHEQGVRCREPTRPASRQRSPRLVMQTCVWHSWATSPACSDSVPRARAATQRTSDCPVCRRTSSRSFWRRGLRWSSWSSPGVRTRSARCTAERQASSRRSCPVRREGRQSRVSSQAGSSPVASCPCRSRGMPEDNPAHTSSHRSVVPRVPASATSTRRRCSPSATAARTRPSSWATCGSATRRSRRTASSRCRSV